MGALAIGTLAGEQLLASLRALGTTPWLLDVAQLATVALWVLASLWSPVLLYVEVWHVERSRGSLHFAGVWWSGVFPLGMYSSATYATACTPTCGRCAPSRWSSSGSPWRSGCWSPPAGCVRRCVVVTTRCQPAGRCASVRWGLWPPVQPQTPRSPKGVRPWPACSTELGCSAPRPWDPSRPASRGRRPRLGRRGPCRRCASTRTPGRGRARSRR